MPLEQCTGIGDLIRNHQVIGRVRYAFSVYQGTLGEGGLPVPGLRTIEGSIDLPESSADLVGADLTLKLEDGRHLGITLNDTNGSISHRAGRPCSCCC
jgi:hypothetical protein